MENIYKYCLLTKAVTWLVLCTGTHRCPPRSLYCFSWLAGHLHKPPAGNSSQIQSLEGPSLLLRLIPRHKHTSCFLCSLRLKEFLRKLGEQFIITSQVVNINKTYWRKVITSSCNANLIDLLWWLKKWLDNLSELNIYGSNFKIQALLYGFWA